METLTELVAKISVDAAELKKGLSDAEGKTEQSSKRMADSLKKVGLAMAASGAAITAAMGLMGKAAIDEEINIKRLTTTLRNVGVSYDKVKDSLEDVISTTQRKTGFADNEQRDILNRLILVTNDYNKALELLPTTLDLAAAGGMDATTAATYLGKAFLELEDGAKEVSVRFGQASLKFKGMEDIQNRVAGAAENLKNPLTGIKNAASDLAETIGSFLIPIIKTVGGWIEDISIRVQEWTKEHPELTKVIILTTTALGLLLGALGAAILVVPKLVAGIKALNAVLLILKINALAAWSALLLIPAVIGTIIAVVDKLQSQWSDEILNPKEIGWAKAGKEIRTTISFIEDGFQTIRTVSDKVLDDLKKQGIQYEVLRDGVETYSSDIKVFTLEHAAELKKQGYEVELYTDQVKEQLTAVTIALKIELAQQRELELAAVKTKEKAAKDKFDAAIQAINEEYGEYKAAAKNKMDLAKDASAADKRALEDGLKEAKRIHNIKISLLQDEYDERIRTLNAGANFEISQIQKQIDAIDEQTEKEEFALERWNERKRLDELWAAAASAETDEDRLNATIAYNEYGAEVERKALLRRRDEEKDALRDRIDDIRTQTQTRAEALQIELESLKTTLAEEYTAFEENQNKISEALDKALEEELARLEKAKIGMLVWEEA